MTHEGNNPDPNQDLHLKQNIEAYLDQRQQWMGDAVVVYAGEEQENRDPLSVFPEPTEVRTAAPAPELTSDQETALREIAGRFGLGGEADVLSAADYQINEGGRARKVDAEARINQGARVIIYSGSPDRLFNPDNPIDKDEIAYLEERLASGTEVAKTEYDMVAQVAGWQEGFVPLEVPEVLPYGYKLQSDHEVTFVAEPTGQVLKIGECNGAEVLHLRVDRENYFDEEEGKNKFCNRPNSAALMGFVSDMLSAQGDETSSVSINSSTTYASRAVDTVQAGLGHGRPFLVGMYGRQTLAHVESKPIAEPTEIHQIPGELHEMQVKLLQLREAVNKKWPPPETAS